MDTRREANAHSFALSCAQAESRESCQVTSRLRGSLEEKYKHFY